MSRALWLIFLASPAAFAQTKLAAPIHWAYGAYFGTGLYELETGDDVYVLSARPGKRFRTAELDEHEGRSIGIELRVPLTVGAYNFDPGDLDTTLRIDNVSTFSAVPGVEFDIPVGPRWSLKPLAYLGWGAEIDGDASAWIYWSGIKSRVRFRTDTFEWALVNALTYIGYSSDTDGRPSMLPLLTGLEFEHALDQKKLGGEQVRLHWHVAYTTYLNENEIRPARTAIEPIVVDDEWEIGAAFSRSQRPLSLWRLRWDRVGLAYRFSRDGSFEGISIVFRSLFDR